MSDGELAAFLDEERIMICATAGPGDLPHLMPLWYVVRDGTLWAWTFAKSQKVRNLERDPRASVLIEAGGGEYDQLRGVMLETDVQIHREPPDVLAIGLAITSRYGGAGVSADARANVEKQASKRVALEFTARRRTSWDHRKFAG